MVKQSFEPGQVAERPPPEDEQTSQSDAGAAPAIKQVRVRILPDGRMTRRDSAAYLGVTEKTMAMWALRGRGPPIFHVGGRVFHYKTDLDAMIMG